jgi:hypothetical protein
MDSEFFVMTFPKVRAIVALCLFVSWLGFLLFLVTQRQSIVLSPPQFLIAQAIIIAEVKSGDGKPDAEVIVQEVPWSADPVGRQLKTVQLLDLPGAQGYRQPGLYVIPLIKRDRHFAIAPLPATGMGPPPVRIYPSTAETRGLVAQIVKEKQ